jgi:hypothetical protein
LLSDVAIQQGATMGYARYVGRIGALAVALGVGYAVAVMPAVAVATPSDSGTAPSSTSQPSASAADKTDDTTPPASTGAQESDDDSADGVIDSQEPDGNGESPADGDDANPPPAATDQDDPPPGKDGSDSGGSADHRNTNRSARTLGTPGVTGKDGPDEDDASFAAKVTASRQQGQTFGIDTSVDAPSGRSSVASADVVTAVSVPPVAIVPAPPPDFEEILEEPQGNHIVTVVIPNQAAIDAGMREGHFIADDHYDHYSLLRTIEDSLGVTTRLTNNDKFAYPMNEFWEV